MSRKRTSAPAEAVPRVPDAVPSGDRAELINAITHDEYAGCGGTYVFDPTTGKRMPVQPDHQET